MADLLTLAQARNALDWKSGQNPDRDAELADDYLPAVTSLIERRCGRMADRRETWTSDDPSPITTPWPSATIKSVTAGTARLTSWTFSAGVLTITDPAYTPGSLVTVVAGGLPVPPDVLLVARRVLKRAWNADRQGVGQGGRSGAAQTPRVTLTEDDLTTLNPYLLIGGFA
jgi:hypothetical protein